MPRSEALHHSLSFSDRDVGVLSAIVQSLMRAVFDIGHDGALRSGVGSQLISHDTFWSASLLSQKPRQQSFGSLGIAARLNDFVQHIPVLIDGAPKRAFLAIDRDDGLV